MSLSLSIFLVLPQISLVKYYETIKILMQIFLYFKLHFDNDACPWQKNYFEVFFSAQSDLLVCRISTLSDTSNRFFANKYHIFCKYLVGIFFNKVLRVFHQSKVELSDLGENWAKTSPLLLQIFESSNCVDSHIVQWAFRKYKVLGFANICWLEKVWKGLQRLAKVPFLNWRPDSTTSAACTNALRLQCT